MVSAPTPAIVAVLPAVKVPATPDTANCVTVSAWPSPSVSPASTPLAALTTSVWSSGTLAVSLSATGAALTRKASSMVSPPLPSTEPGAAVTRNVTDVNVPLSRTAPAAVPSSGSIVELMPAVPLRTVPTVREIVPEVSSTTKCLLPATSSSVMPGVCNVSISELAMKLP